MRRFKLYSTRTITGCINSIFLCKPTHFGCNMASQKKHGCQAKKVVQAFHDGERV